MGEYIIHDDERVLNRLVADKPVPCGMGQSCVEAVGAWDGCNGQLVDPGVGVIADPPRPSPFYVFDKVNRTWSITPEDQAKEDAQDTADIRADEYEACRNAHGLNRQDCSDMVQWVTDQFASAKTRVADASSLEALKTEVIGLIDRIVDVNQKEVPFIFER